MCPKQNYLVLTQMWLPAVTNVEEVRLPLATCPGHVLACKRYWKVIFQTLSLNLNFNLEPNCLLALFGTTGEDGVRLTPIKCCMLFFASLLARHAVLLTWREAAPPTHTLWLRDIVSCLNLEKTYCSVCNSDKSSWIFRMYILFSCSQFCKNVLEKKSVFPIWKFVKTTFSVFHPIRAYRMKHCVLTCDWLWCFYIPEGTHHMCQCVWNVIRC